MENKYTIKAKYYELLSKLVSYIDDCHNSAVSCVSETSNKLSTEVGLDKWDTEYYQTILEDAKLSVKAWADIKEAILATLN